ncbi:outer dynein arm protein (macronuclear) [Tetrahymena thermophila SB210]|uniref:Outer dynein arm protein n=1 Tax=Tetrahymena thermophila (strain SB210) TaxID=312017 RepID=I7MA82_TETTS|nr:outer dynein arm protein [Tetrahymena thermophila SB210]EAS03889.2 outer dynein arm protein [Tetrahymena thermophila SB210]|eukprot:XP_001024134.2 outer dynein arm protein [Tetrahymena thermophila SB210]
MSRSSNRSFSYSDRNNKSMNMESDVVTMQREIDTYTRKLELEKKRLYSISHMINQVNKESEERKERIKEMKKIQENSKNKQATSHMVTLKKAIDQYEKRKDHALDSVEKVKLEIDNLRKQRMLCIEQIDNLQKEIEKSYNQTEQLAEENDRKAQKSVMNQQQMYDLRQKNDMDKETYQKELDSLQYRMKEEKVRRERLNKSMNTHNRIERSGDVLIDTFDTSGVLKRRLQKIIYKNKEKVRLIDQYIRNMTIIDDAFNQIKETTGITDIVEIQNTFIKSEEQNYSLLTYVDVLNQQIDHMKDQNNEISQKIEEQEKENVDKKRVLLSTPDDEKFRKKVESMLKVKQNSANEFQSFLDKICPQLEKLLVRFAGSKFNVIDSKKEFEFQNGLILNESTLDYYLSDLESFITEQLLYLAKKNDLPVILTSTLQTDEIPVKEFKQKITQSVNYNPNKDQTLDEQEVHSTLMNKNKFTKIAEDFLDKKKQNHHIPSQNQRSQKKQ